MSDTKPAWKPGKKDALFLAVVVTVITLLALGSHERTTKATPNDEVHRVVTSHEACLQCHASGTERSLPVGHTASVQCFQCHTQPKSWQGSAR